MKKLIAPLLWLALAAVASAQDAPPVEAPKQTVEEIEVERAKAPKQKLENLRFLRENKDFLRAQLDRLRMTVHLREGEALMLSDRDLKLQDLMAALTAAWDSLSAEEDRLSQRELLQSIAELGDLEAQLDRIEALLRDQRDRLGVIEDDFVGRQRTAMTLLVTGMPQEDPAALVVADADGESMRIPLDAAQREALRQGAVAQLFHDFVEPRPTALHLRVERADGSEWNLGVVRLTPSRDRLTFVQLDLSQLPASAEVVETELPATVWER